VKFQPASGAASWMFKDLFGFWKVMRFEQKYLCPKFMNNIEKFAFYDDLNEVLKKSAVLISWTTKDHKGILAALLVTMV
jgi:hypothetical protein